MTMTTNDWREQRTAEQRAADKRAKDAAFTTLLTALEAAYPGRFTDVPEEKREPSGYVVIRHVHDTVTGGDLWLIRVGRAYFSEGKLGWSLNPSERRATFGTAKPNVAGIVKRLTEVAEAKVLRAKSEEHSKTVEAQAKHNGAALGALLAPLFPGKAVGVENQRGYPDTFTVKVGKATKMRNAGTREEPNWVYDDVVGPTTEYVTDSPIEFRVTVRADEAGQVYALTLREVMLRGFDPNHSDPTDNLGRLNALVSLVAAR